VILMMSSACRREAAPADRAAAPGSAATRPNVLLIVVDTVRADRLSVYGYAKPTSPFLEKFAGEGTRFENAYAQALWTRPAIPSLLTSTYVSEHGNVSSKPPIQQLPSCQPDLVEVLQRNGYETAAFTGTFLPGSFYEAWGWSRGFDFLNVDWYAREVHARDHPKKDPHTHRQIDVNVVRDFADWLSDKTGPKPFFAYIHLLGGHGPFETPDRYSSKFMDRAKRDRFLKEFGHSYEWDPFRSSSHPEEVEYVSAAYDASLRFTDQNLRYIVEELDKRGLRENTVVAVVADHGENLFENGLVRAWSHGPPNPPRQPIARIPLIFSGPRIPRGSVIREEVMQIDVAPTILSLAGVKPPPTMRGINLMDRAAIASRKGAIIESDFFNKIKSVVIGRWKYTRVFPDIHLGYSAESGYVGESLVDLASDPSEKENVYPSHPDETRRMRNALASRVLSGASGWHVRLRGNGSPQSYELRVRSAGDVRWVALYYQHPESPVDLKTIASTSVLTIPGPVPVPDSGLLLTASSTPSDAQAYVFGAFVKSDGAASRIKMSLEENPRALLSASIEPSAGWSLLWGYALGPVTNPPNLEITTEGAGKVSVKDAFVSPAQDSFAWEVLPNTEELTIPLTVADGIMDVNFQFIDETAPVTIEVRKGGVPLHPNRLWIAKTPNAVNPTTLRPADAFWPSRDADRAGNRLVDAEIYYSGLCGGTATSTSAETETEALKHLKALGYLK
jgi:arylsulfatase A-like enzyme